MNSLGNSISISYTSYIHLPIHHKVREIFYPKENACYGQNGQFGGQSGAAGRTAGPSGAPPGAPGLLPNTYSASRFGEDRAARREVRRAGLCAGPSGAWPGAAELTAELPVLSSNGCFSIRPINTCLLPPAWSGQPFISCSSSLSLLHHC